jgi:hypothetical protein
MSVDNDNELPGDDVLDARRVREVTGILRSMTDLYTAVEQLLAAGFDRADLDLIGPVEALKRRFGSDLPPLEELADIPETPRQPVMLKDDFRDLEMVAVAITAYLTGVSAVIVAVSLRADFWYDLFFGAFFAVAGGVLAFLVTRQLRRRRLAQVEEILGLGGIPLWVRVNSPGDETRALDILNGNHADAVRVHELIRTKRVSDIPFIPRDPWLEPTRPLDH